MWNLNKIPGADMIIVKKIFCKICFKKYGVKKKCKELFQGKSVYYVQAYKIEKKISRESFKIIAKSHKEAEKEVLHAIKYECRGGEPMRCSTDIDNEESFSVEAFLTEHLDPKYDAQTLEHSIDLTEEP